MLTAVREAESTAEEDAGPEDVSPKVEVTGEIRQQFLDALRNSGGSSGNMKLRDNLGWDISTYNTIRDDLVAAAKVAKGLGKGGSVKLI